MANEAGTETIESVKALAALDKAAHATALETLRATHAQTLDTLSAASTDQAAAFAAEKVLLAAETAKQVAIAAKTGSKTGQQVIPASTTADAVALRLGWIKPGASPSRA